MGIWSWKRLVIRHLRPPFWRELPRKADSEKRYGEYEIAGRSTASPTRGSSGEARDAGIAPDLRVVTWGSEERYEILGPDDLNGWPGLPA